MGAIELQDAGRRFPSFYLARKVANKSADVTLNLDEQLWDTSRPGRNETSKQQGCFLLICVTTHETSIEAFRLAFNGRR
jgi:hypothetical protein